jgi:hypothetical protein
MSLSKFSMNAATKVEVTIVRWRSSRNSGMLEGRVQLRLAEERLEFTWPTASL